LDSLDERIRLEVDMKAKILFSLFLTLLLLCAFSPLSARADGIIIPVPPICDPGLCPTPCPFDRPCPPPLAELDIRYHHVTVTIQDQLAVTHVDQVFHNPNDWTVEGTYIFPIPQDAAVSSFTLWVDGKPVEGKVLDAEQARQSYEEIVRSQRDPALLEYSGRGAVQAHIFPIPPQGERRIELEYTQALPADNGLVRYIYPLNTEKFSAAPLESVSVSVDIHSKAPIRAVYSPTHEVGISREDENHVSAGYEASNVRPDTDFAVYYSIGEGEALHLLTTRDPADPAGPDGFFLLMLAPRPDAAAQIQAKDVLLVLDHSGSMDGEKFQQVQQAVHYILGQLNSEDRFNLVAFSTSVETYAEGLRPAAEAKEALTWVEKLSAQGSTDINRALLESAAEGGAGGRPLYIIFLTDGLPTEGETEPQKILDNLAAAAPASLRLFAFGVGYDVDTFLLDSLAQAHHGASIYVKPGERLDEILSTFYAKISTPVLTDLSLDFGGVSTYDLYPSPLPDLFSGSQIILVGRYRGPGGAATITLGGMVNGQAQTFKFPDQVFSAASEDITNGVQSSIPRLWATRKIGYLLQQISLHGPDKETIDQIVKLSVRYGIVTPYTSYLVTEQAPLGEAEQQRLAEQQYKAMSNAPAAPASGQEAVNKAADQGALAGAEAPAAPMEAAADLVRVVGPRAFVFSNGAWTDTAFDPQKMPTTKLEFLSEDYFALAERRPDLAAAFALGEKVIALADGVAYEVTTAGSSQPAIELPPAVTPTGEAVSQAFTPTTQPAVTPAAGTPASSAPASQPASSSFPCASAVLPLLLALLVFSWRRLRT
jgi:Ca-activated chloride channel family protein